LKSKNNTINDTQMNRSLPLMDIIKTKWSKLKLFDQNLVIYWSLLSLVILIFQQNLSHWLARFIIHLLLIGAIITIIPWLDSKQNPLIRFIRNWYIIFAFPFLYWDVGPLLHIVSAGEFDHLIIRMDHWIFGQLPNIWVQKLVNPWLTEIMQVSYSIYWITIPLGGALFYFRKEFCHFERLLFYVTITFFFSYFIFVFFPVAGPRFYLADQISANYHGFFISNLLRNFVQNAAFRGGAFPSSHVGVAVVILIYVWHFRPRIAAFVFLPLVIALSLATIYGQYHYFTDVLAGLLMGIIIGFRAGRKSRLILKPASA
jgi:membrane-associated phospholipid phosphatase